VHAENGVMIYGENCKCAFMSEIKIEVLNLCSGARRHMSHEKYHGWLGCIGDDILPSYIGILINHERRIPINQPG